MEESRNDRGVRHTIETDSHFPDPSDGRGEGSPVNPVTIFGPEVNIEGKNGGVRTVTLGCRLCEKKWESTGVDSYRKSTDSYIEHLCEISCDICARKWTPETPEGYMDAVEQYMDHSCA